MIDPFEAAGPLRPAYLGVDWSATPLGPVAAWSPTLLGTVDLMLRTRNAVTLLWGPEYVLVYNDAYVAMIGDKHPAALGAPAREVFAEIWDEIGPMLDAVRSGGEATWTEDMLLLMDRRGYSEETYFTFSYSAVRGADGAIEGIIDIASETTAQVIGRRRLELLARLTDTLADVETVPQLVERALPVLRADPADLPDADLVTGLVDPADDRLHVPVGDGLHLVTRMSRNLPDDADYRGFRRLVSAALLQGLNRMAARRAAADDRQMSEVLQRSLLSHPAQPEHLEVAVRYHPAAEGAQVGGDWYDAFLLPDGRLALTVGDVAGHDREAAAAMSQIRNLLRGISYATPDPPARVLTALGDAMLGLGVDTFATVVLAQVDLATYEMRWSNAGHPPPMLIDGAGAVRVLARRAETLLGVAFPVRRSDHGVRLDPGATVVFFTDGLIERRTQRIDQGLAVLRDELGGLAGRTADEVCDHLSERFAGRANDDIVLMVVRRRPD